MAGIHVSRTLVDVGTGQESVVPLEAWQASFQPHAPRFSVARVAISTLAHEAPVGIQTRCLRLQLQPPHSELNLLILQSDKWKLPAQLL